MIKIRILKIENFIFKNKWIILILLLASFLRFFNLGFQSLWLDEIYTMNISSPNQTWATFHKELIKREGFPHLYFVLLRFLYFIFDYTPFVARSFSAVTGIAGVYAIYLIGKELYSSKIGLFAALLLSVNSYHILMSQDARPYTFYALAATLSFYRLVVFLKNHTIKNAVLYGILTGLMLNTNFFAWINVFSQSIIILFFIAITERNNRFELFKTAIISGAIAVFLFAINYEKFFILLKAKVFWVKPPNPDSASNILKTFFGNSEIIGFLTLLLILFYLFNLFQNSEEKKWNYNNIISNKLLFSFLILFGWFAIFFSFLFLKSYGKISYLLTRYFISVLPVFFILLAISINFIKGQTVQIIMIFSVVFFSLSNIFIVQKYYTIPNKPQFREVSSFVMSKNKTLEKTYTSQKYWFDYYFNKKATNIKLENIAFEKLIQSFIKNPEKAKSFWYLDAFKKTYMPSKKVEEFIAKNYTIETKFDGYKAWAKHFVVKENK